MKKEKIILPVGSSKALVFEADPGDEWQRDFAKQCKEVAATKPTSIQEFFIRLSNLQEKNAEQWGQVQEHEGK